MKKGRGPTAARYDLDVAFLPGDGEVEATARIRVRNATDRKRSTIPFLLRRLLGVAFEEIAARYR